MNLCRASRTDKGVHALSNALTLKLVVDTKSDLVTLYPLPLTLYPRTFILYLTPYTPTLYPCPIPIPYTLSPIPIPYTLYPIPYTLHPYPIPYTLYSVPYTLYSIPWVHALSNALTLTLVVDTKSDLVTLSPIP